LKRKSTRNYPGSFPQPIPKPFIFDRSGQVTVGEPWWLGFADRGEQQVIDLQNMVQNPQQLIQALSNIAKMMEDSAGNTTQKSG
jgi:hypothetical protein